MCQFASWIEHDNKNYFLTDADLDTKEGRALVKKMKQDRTYYEDICGHGAIRAYYPEIKGGTERECVDFSTPELFPKDVAFAIKSCRMTLIGFDLELLNEDGVKNYKEVQASALAKYNEVTDAALAKYNEVTDAALAKYNEVTDAALAKYNEVQAPAWAKYREVQASAWAKYKEVQAPAWAKYREVRDAAWAKYREVRDAALAKYNEVTDAALAKYREVQASAFWKIFKQKKYRNKKWL